jgi:hypothetical protein
MLPAAAVFDDQIWIFRGLDASGNVINDCWSWEGGSADWVERPAPPAVAAGTNGTQSLLCAAGDTLHAFANVNGAWAHMAYAGGAWTTLSDTPPFAPAGTVLAGLAAYEGYLLAVGAQAWVYTG